MFQDYESFKPSGQVPRNWLSLILHLIMLSEENPWKSSLGHLTSDKSRPSDFQLGIYYRNIQLTLSLSTYPGFTHSFILNFRFRHASCVCGSPLYVNQSWGILQKPPKGQIIKVISPSEDMSMDYSLKMSSVSHRFHVKSLRDSILDSTIMFDYVV